MTGMLAKLDQAKKINRQNGNDAKHLQSSVALTLPLLAALATLTSVSVFAMLADAFAQTSGNA